MINSEVILINDYQQQNINDQQLIFSCDSTHISIQQQIFQYKQVFDVYTPETEIYDRLYSKVIQNFVDGISQALIIQSSQQINYLSYFYHQSTLETFIQSLAKKLQQQLDLDRTIQLVELTQYCVCLNKQNNIYLDTKITSQPVSIQKLLELQTTLYQNSQYYPSIVTIKLHQKLNLKLSESELVIFTIPNIQLQKQKEIQNTTLAQKIKNEQTVQKKEKQNVQSQNSKYQYIRRTFNDKFIDILNQLTKQYILIPKTDQINIMLHDIFDSHHQINFIIYANVYDKQIIQLLKYIKQWETIEQVQKWETTNLYNKENVLLDKDEYNKLLTICADYGELKQRYNALLQEIKTKEEINDQTKALLYQQINDLQVEQERLRSQVNLIRGEVKVEKYYQSE